MKALLQVLSGLYNDHEDCMLVTITQAQGSTPGRCAASMVVTKEGRRFGTIGGGAVELSSERLAMELLEKKRSHLERYRLHQNEIADIGMICGGENDVYFRCIPAADAAAAAVFAEALERIAQGNNAWMTMELSEGANGRFELNDGTKEELPEAPAVFMRGGRAFFAKKLISSGKVWLFGAGHISRALAPLLASLSFECVVCDDRPEFLRSDRFSSARTERIDPTDISNLAAEIGEADYVCIMTHGHKDDYEIQRQVMKTSAAYIGVIGSARKQRSVKERLMAAGYTEADFEAVVSPIGLNIGADTPEEIAVSIAAQLIMVRAGRGYGQKDWKR